MTNFTVEDLQLIKGVDLSELHDCEKCHGKLVGITVDLVGVQRCGYCHQVVDYTGFFRRKIAEAKREIAEKNGLPK